MKIGGFLMELKFRVTMRTTIFLKFAIIVSVLVKQTNASVEPDEIDEEDDEPANQRKKVVVSSTKEKRGLNAATQLKTEDLIKESKRKAEDKYISATVQVSAAEGLNLGEVDTLVAESWHNWCGCGGMSCERFAKCKLNNFKPLCCENKCKCVKVEKAELEDYWKTLKRDTACKLLGCDNPLKSSCYDVAAAEFNCWTHYNEANADETINEEPREFAAPPKKKELKETEPTIQFAFFGCGL